MTPIDMILHCPACGKQHIDAPEMPPMSHAIGLTQSASRPLWNNPSHRSHLCHGCGHVWRPADVPTNGVDAVKTKGKDDSPPADPAQAGRAAERAAYEAGRAAERAEWVRDVGAMRSLHFAHILRRQFTSDVGRWKVQDSEATVDARLASASGEQPSDAPLLFATSAQRKRHDEMIDRVVNGIAARNREQKS